MSEKIFSDVEFEFLDLFDITMKNGKLIKEDTNEEFTYNPEISFEDNYVYECGDIKVDFQVSSFFSSNETTKIPSAVVVFDNNFAYTMYSFCAGEERNLYTIERKINIMDLKNIGEYEVSIKPNVGENFIITEFNVPKFKDPIFLKCDFNEVKPRPLIRERLPISLENYKSAFESMVLDLYPKKIVNAIIKCAPFIYQGYYLYSHYPVKYYDEFKRCFDKREADINKEFIDQIKSANRRKEESINHRIYDLAESTSRAKETLIYLEAVSKFSDSIGSCIDSQEKAMKKYEELLNSFNEYVKSIEETDKKNKLY